MVRHIKSPVSDEELQYKLHMARNLARGQAGQGPIMSCDP